MSDAAARGVGDAIAQFVYLSMLDLAGQATAMTQREALRERIRQYVTEHLGDPGLTVESIAHALNCSRRHLYNAFAEEEDGVAGCILRRRLEACRKAFDDAANRHRSITDIALGFCFSNMAHFSRVFRARLGVPPSDYRRGAGALLQG
jgi:AraC-like DNA-binding protein